jgi:molybdenum cofactor cytidylyltransferase
MFRKAIDVKTTEPTVALVILAAGGSTRMGQPKQLLPYRGRSLLYHVVEEAIASVCRPVVVILGANANQIRAEIDELPIHIVDNPKWTEGMGTSICQSIEYLNTLSQDIEAVVFTVCDQPFISSEIFDQLVKAYFSSRKPIIASEYAKTIGVPALFSQAFFFELMNLQKNKGAKQVILDNYHQIYTLAFPQGEIDLDTPDDYKLFISNNSFLNPT